MMLPVNEPVHQDIARELLRSVAPVAGDVRFYFYLESPSGTLAMHVYSDAAIIGDVRIAPRQRAVLSEGAVVARIAQEVRDIVRRHEAQARIPAEQHKRLKAAALNRRRHLLAPIRKRRGTQ
jgi:hypothetical protein